ncbi:MAG: hypothetical protein IJT19_00315 [Bacteroidaceae bacterium]|nr:hypothetical protein [Bacteroidaceae bacterium]
MLSKNKAPEVKLEIEVQGAANARRQTMKFSQGDSLYDASKLPAYKEFVITDINVNTNTVYFRNGDHIKNNPEEFIRKVIKIIKEQKATMIVEHISYNRTEQTYDTDIFTQEKSRQTVDKAYPAKKHILDYVFTDSQGERRFAEDMDSAAEVSVYAKLPRTFKIPTPVGNYAPDWAIAFHDNAGVKHIFFIAETKGSMDSMQLKGVEKAKIVCAKKLFNEMSTSKVRYHEVDSYDNLLKVMQKLQ